MLIYRGHLTETGKWWQNSLYVQDEREWDTRRWAEMAIQRTLQNITRWRHLQKVKTGHCSCLIWRRTMSAAPAIARVWTTPPMTLDATTCLRRFLGDADQWQLAGSMVRANSNQPIDDITKCHGLYQQNFTTVSTDAHRDAESNCVQGTRCSCFIGDGRSSFNVK